MTQLITLSPEHLARRGGFDSLLEGPPALLHDLFGDSPIRGLGLAEVLELLADEPVKLVESYEQFLGPFHGEPRTYSATYTKFLELAAEAENLPLYVSENPTPQVLRDRFDLPKAMNGPYERARSFTFIGAAGNCAPFHFDGDSRHVLLYQLFGTKRVYMLPAKSGRQLCPVFNFASVRFHDLDHAARCRFVEDAGGWWAEVGPGEALYFGPGVWHCIEYLDFTMSVNFRFGRTFNHFLQSRLPVNHRLGVLMALASAKLDPREELEWIRKSLAIFYRGYPRGRDRYQAMIERYDARLAELGVADQIHRPYPSGDLEAQAVAGEIDLMAGRLPGLDYALRVGAHEIEGEAHLDEQQLEPLFDAREAMDGDRWDRWMDFFGLPHDPRELDGFAAALINDFINYGITTREPEAHGGQA